MAEIKEIGIGLSVLGEHAQERGRRIRVEKGVMALNDQYAAANRARLRAAGVRTLNLLSSPGAGKTTLLSRTLQDLQDSLSMAVIVGDLATDNDAQRLRVGGATAVQIQTGTLCHLEAAMIERALEPLNLEALDLLFIENVGNLVCPAAYDLGEDARVVLFSTTEGEDKPLKYPRMFKSADLILVTKSDLAEAVGFDRASALENLGQVAPQAAILEVSTRTGMGLEAWYDFLRRPN
ncbi:hydrogenase nickel incorporation protein HypB [uncultured Meiothermus sp.]|jgi:hydrogenase nickel incorporation protein HypB|uniref:hydrogenase nickel incorporation protein HypB n=1 Tax=uncultured Meiothermus sp. TaxID=157471 RepID=UPI00261AEB94|nr:hydrogenase nickel incorporation protein HypB [uncultured Meiothermus sp.]